MPTGSRSNEPSTFGVWVESPPLTPLRGEGIGQLLVHLLRGAAERPGQKVVVACASWTAPDLKKLAAEYDVPASSVEFVVASPREPLFVRIKQALRERRKRKRKPRGKRLKWHAALRAEVVRFGERLCAPCITGRSWVGFAAGALLVLFVWAVLAVPLALLYLPQMASAAFKTLGAAAGRLGGLKGVQALRGGVSAALQSFFARAYQGILDGEYRALSDLVRRRKDVKAWFVPIPWAKGPKDAGVPVVVALPDAVYADFPALFGEPMGGTDRRIQETTSKASALVVYSEHVKAAHAGRLLGFPLDRTYVVRHASMGVRETSLPVDAAEGRHHSPRLPGDRIRRYVVDLARRAAEEPSADVQYLRDYPFEEVDFLFVSSQLRPHKTMRKLLEALDFLVRRRYRPIKLFTTGRLGSMPETLQYVRERRLERDVLSVPDLPADVHAAFYRLAKLTVVPSLFEGGFPFPFTESLSVDTPVVMSSMPCTRELLPLEVRPRILFDPYDSNDLAEKIAWALDHREELLAIERPIYQEMAKRTWSVVAGEYLDVFDAVARRSAAERGSKGSVAPPPAVRRPSGPHASRSERSAK